ncbi:MAG: hypothetical protein NC394_07435 [Bacteroides sp.]|nr:hypothetical protein [Bacteroides sp.]
MIIKTVDLERKMREEDEFDEDTVLENKAPDIHILINKYIVEKNILHKDIIHALNVERSYGYQILNGKRTPTRNQLVKISLLLKLDYDQTQRLLKTAKKEVLYPRDMTDAKIIYSIEHDLGFEAACKFIWNE